MQPVQGIHHITAFASDLSFSGNPQANVDFYHNLLGQRLVKTTVNFDDPGTYHLYYGDNVGTPGTIMTYFPWPQGRRGVRGNGEIGAMAYSIDSRSVGYWLQRLTDHGAVMSKTDTRFGAEVIPFRDPDGLILELIVYDSPATFQFWQEGPIPAQHTLRGFHSVTWLC